MNSECNEGSKLHTTQPLRSEIQHPKTQPMSQTTTKSITGKEGWMWKRGGFNPAYKKRYWRLNGKVLEYFTDEKSTQPQGSINLAKSELVFDESGHSLAFRLAGHDRTFKIKTDQQKETESWLSLLKPIAYRVSALKKIQLDSRSSIEANKKECKSDMEGWLLKRGGLNPSFKKRYFKLIGGFLYYFPDAKSVEPSGTIDLSEAELNTDTENMGKNTFQIVIYQRIYTIKAEKSVDFFRWVELIFKRTQAEAEEQARALAAWARNRRDRQGYEDRVIKDARANSC